MQNLDLKNVYDWPKSMQGVIFALVFVVVLYFGYLIDISDSRKGLSDAKIHEQTLKEQLEAGVRKEAAISLEISQFPVLSAQLHEWQKKLIKPENLSELLNDILKIGADNHLYFSLLDPLDSQAVGVYTKIPIRAKVVGNYQEISEFVSQVANLPWIVMIGDFAIVREVKPVKDNKSQVVVEGALLGDFTFEVYHLSEVSEAPDEAKPTS